MITHARISVALLLSTLFFLMLNVFPLQALPVFEYSYDWRRILQFLILAIFVLWLLCDNGLRRQWLQCHQAIPKLARLGITLFFIWGLVSALLAPLPKYALMQVGCYGLFWVAVVTIAALRQLYREKFDHWVLVLLIIMAGVYGIYLLFVDVSVWFFGGNKGLSDAVLALMTASPSFLNIRFFANFLSFSLPLIVLPSLLYRHHAWPLRWIYFAVSAVWWYAMILNHCQTLWLEWLVFVGVALFWFRSAGFAWLKQQVKAFLGGMVLFVLLTHLLSFWLAHHEASVVQNAISYSDDGRFALWSYTLKMIAHHPFFGVGPLHFSYYDNHLGVAHPHDAVLLIGAEWGVPALLLLLVLVLWGITAWVKRYRKSPVMDVRRVIYIGLSAAFVGCGIDALLSGFVVMPLSQTALILLVGWMMGWYRSDSVSTVMIEQKQQLVLVGMLLIMGLLVLQGLIPMIFFLPEQVSFYIQQACGGVYSAHCIISPAFWTQGWIHYYPI